MALGEGEDGPNERVADGLGATSSSGATTNPWTPSDLQQVFNFALRNGVNLFDTADSYGTGTLNGQSERLLGKFICEFPGNRDDVVIATKFAAYPWQANLSMLATPHWRGCKLSRLE